MSSSKLVEFYFDFASPYSYFAARRLGDLAADTGCSVVWRPIMVGAAFKASGNRPLMDQPIKGEYTAHDLARMSRHFGVRFCIPETFPVATLAAARGFYWIEETVSVDKAIAFAHAAFDAYFGHGRDISNPGVLSEVAKETGIDPAALAEGVATQAVKDKLRAETDEAVARGVFGVPFFFVEGEPFWGQDRMDMVKEWIEKGGW